MYKKLGVVLLTFFLVLGLAACQSKEENKASEETQEKEVDLSSDPVNGDWTLNQITTDGATSSAAELIDSGELADSITYTFKEDGTIESQNDIFELTTLEWTKKDGEYKAYAVDDSELGMTYSDNTLEISGENVSITLVKGVKTSEELLKEAGLWHVDELLITNHTVRDTGHGFFIITYEIKNNTAQEITFQSISMKELDSNNTILSEYNSNNKNHQPSTLAPGQSMNLEITFSFEDGISTIENSSYQYKTDPNSTTTIEGTFSTPYIVQL